MSPSRRPSSRPRTVAIVIDVLRATSTMCQALASGYERVLCCAEIDDARALAQTEGPAKLAGERRLEHIEGFDFGNSPRELEGAAAAPTLILTTTNGTRLLVAAAERYERVYVGSLLNVDAVAAAARESGEDVAVLCAGVLGELALDDAYCAGRIVAGDRRRAGGLRAGRDPLAAELPERARRSRCEPQRGEPPTHGMEADVDVCARENVLDVVPRYVRRVGPAAEVTA